MPKTPLILILGVGINKENQTNCNQYEINMLKKYAHIYSTSKIVYYKVDFSTLKPRYTTSAIINPDTYHDKFRLIKVIFDIGSITGFNFIVAEFVNKIISTIRDKEFTFDSDSIYRNCSNFSIGDYPIDDIMDDYDLYEHVRIYTTHPIAGCWYRFNDEAGLVEYIDCKFNNIENPLGWIAESDSTIKELYYDGATVYYGIRLSAYHINYPNKIKVMYNGICVGDVIDIDKQFAIIHINRFPDKDYAQYSQFIGDIIDAKAISNSSKISSDNNSTTYGDIITIQLITNKNYKPARSKEEVLKSLISDYSDRYAKLTQMMSEQKITMEYILELLEEKEVE